MPRKRIIYNTLGAASNRGTIAGVQSMNYDFNLPYQNVTEYGNLGIKDQIINGQPDVNLSIGYLLNNIDNEFKIGLSTGNGTLSGIFNDNFSLNFTGFVGKEGIDLSGQIEGLLLFKSGYLTNYSVRGGVGELGTVQAQFACNDLNFKSNLAVGASNNLMGYNFELLKNSSASTAISTFGSKTVTGGLMTRSAGISAFASTTSWGSQGYVATTSVNLLSGIRNNEFFSIPIFSTGNFKIIITGIGPLVVDRSPSGPTNVALLYNNTGDSISPTLGAKILSTGIFLQPDTPLDILNRIYAEEFISNFKNNPMIIEPKTTGYFYIIPFNASSVGGRFFLTSSFPMATFNNDLSFIGSIYDPDQALLYKQVIPTGFTQPQTCGENTLSLNLTGLGMSTGDFKIQNFDLSLNINRQPEVFFGEDRARYRYITYPIEINLTSEVILGDTATSTVNSMLGNLNSTNLILTTPLKKYEIGNCKLVSQNFSSSIGPSKTATLNFKSVIGGANDNLNYFRINPV